MLKFADGRGGLGVEYEPPHVAAGGEIVSPSAVTALKNQWIISQISVDHPFTAAHALSR
jgi:hypothetical protein